MNFSLRTFLLLFPALIVSYVLAQGCWPGVQSYSGPRSVWSRENFRLHLFQHIAEVTKPVTSLTDWASSIDDYLIGKAAIPAALSASWDANVGQSFRLDSWGQPYRCVVLGERLHFYSCGHDGASQSTGNDPDDLNSWDEHAVDYYIDRHQEEQLRKRRLEALWFMPLTLAFVGWWWVKLRKSSEGATPAEPNDSLGDASGFHSTDQ